MVSLIPLMTLMHLGDHHNNKIAKNPIEWIREQFTIDILTPNKNPLYLVKK